MLRASVTCGARPKATKSRMEPRKMRIKPVIHNGCRSVVRLTTASSLRAWRGHSVVE